MAVVAVLAQRALDDQKCAQPVEDKVKVALLLPLSGGSAILGEALLHGAEMALFDIADNRFTLLVKDTGDTPDGARAATDAAIGEGARLILGPLFGISVITC